MKIIFLYLLLVLMIAFSGCKKEPINTGLADKWEWISSDSYIGIIGVHSTPQILGYTYTVEYTNDGKYKKYDQYNHLVLTYPYTLLKAVSIYDNQEHDMIQLNNSEKWSFQIRKDSLFLVEENTFRFQEVFVRK